MTILETPRLRFRRLLPEDLDDLAAIHGNAEVRRYFPEGVLTRGETREELEWFLNGHPDDPRLGLWATIHKETGRFIGRCGLLLWDIEGKREVEVAYMLEKRSWHQGLGVEAAQAIVRYGFDRLKLPRLIALIDPQNQASIRTAMKAGLAFEREIEFDGLRAFVFAISRPPDRGRIAVRPSTGSG
jgi:ribosomal-protein-alanine N-acetyltransferase